ncbi:shikimate dehydrogenase [Yaniella halotolerans]|uniref:shikimate dehydrogenase n=1 Tax=Yaniella halotolerans TaxID=225453 RepID=UPI0003B37475|nr:shikimate dehydrogenase [Yaniella halotolerans]
MVEAQKTQGWFQAAVLGSPIQHSKSPIMHRAAYDVLGVPITYQRFELTVSEVEDFMSSLSQRYGSVQQIAGFSVTMPLKAALVPHMNNVSNRVARLGVLNTVVFDRNGIPSGHNTDVDGIRRALALSDSRANLGSSMGILGAGGTASAAIAAAAETGMDAVVLYVRNPEKAQDSLDVAHHYGLSAQVKMLTDLPRYVQEHRAVVSTLPAGAADWLAAQLPEYDLPPLLDVIYEPWPTVLVERWKASGVSVASGLDMLLHQGVEQVKLFTQKLVDPRTTIDWQPVTSHMARALGLPGH